MDALIVDMDGTLCDVSTIRHYVTGQRKDFRSFHEASRFGPPRPDVERLVHAAVAARMAIVVVTAREVRYERATRDFLVRNSLPFAALFMRRWGDQRPDSQVKREIFADIVAAGFRPVAAIDDREDIAEVWRSFGVPTVLVATPDSPG